MRKLISYVLVFVLGFVVCAWAIHYYYGSPREFSAQSAGKAGGGGIKIINSEDNEVRDAARVVSEYVVNIDTVGRPRRVFGPGDDFGFFGFPFGGPEEVVPRGQGSGVIFTPDGYIVTNSHVVQGAATLTVTLKNGKRYPAKLIGRDPQSDLAVLKIDATGLKYAKFADSNTLQVGDWVIAVGSPLGFESTVTVGVVSATRRGPLNINGKVLEKVIQTDAAINPGNSGGALADLHGNLVGINTAIASTSGGSVGIGFAIPSNTAEKIAEQIKDRGKVIRPYLGVRYTGLNDEDRGQIERALRREGVRVPPKIDGALVVEVYDGSPAKDAGLCPFDVIMEINGKPVSGDLKRQPGKVTVADEISKAKIGERITLKVWHNSSGHTGAVGVRVAEQPTGFGEQQQ